MARIFHGHFGDFCIEIAGPRPEIGVELTTDDEQRTLRLAAGFAVYVSRPGDPDADTTRTTGVRLSVDEDEAVFMPELRIWLRRDRDAWSSSERKESRWERLRGAGLTKRVDLLAWLGRPESTTLREETERTEISLLGEHYMASIERKLIQTRRAYGYPHAPRWMYNVEIEGGLPIWSKYGADHIHNSAAGGFLYRPRTEDVLGKLVANALSDRMRYGGSLMPPTPKDYEDNLVN